MKVSKETLQKLAWDSECDDLKVVEKTITGTGRWSVRYEQILQHVPTGLFYVMRFSKGATEQQAEDPYEYEADQIELQQVLPIEKTVTVYEPAQEAR